MENKENNHQRKREDMLLLVQAFKSSGLTQDIFCKQHLIPYNVFQYWYRKFKQESSPATNGFIEIKTKPCRTLSSSCEITFPSGAKLKMENVDSGFIRSLIL